MSRVLLERGARAMRSEAGNCTGDGSIGMASGLTKASKVTSVSQVRVVRVYKRGTRMWMWHDGCGISAGASCTGSGKGLGWAWVVFGDIWKAVGELPIQLEDGIGIVKVGDLKV